MESEWWFQLGRLKICEKYAANFHWGPWRLSPEAINQSSLSIKRLLIGAFLEYPRHLALYSKCSNSKATRLDLGTHVF